MSKTVLSTLQLHQTTSATSATTSFAACTWLGHCLGDTCASNDDCDNDWICVKEKCSTCCETQGGSTESSTASSTGLPTSSPTTTLSPVYSPDHGLHTTSAIGIGVGIAGFLIVCVAAGLWLWLRRRRRRGTTVAGRNTGSGSAPYRAGNSAGDSDRKRLVSTTTSSTAELPCPPSQPEELLSVELVELEGSPIVGTQKDLVAAPDQTLSPRARGYRFQEYEASPNDQASGGWTYTPVRGDSQPYTSSPSTAIQGVCRSHSMPCSDQPTINTSQSQPPHGSSPATDVSSLRSRPIYQRYSSITPISPVSSALAYNPGNATAPQSSVSPLEMDPRGQHDEQSHLIHSQHAVSNDGARFIATDGLNHEPYTLFRWPSTTQGSYNYTTR